MWYPTPPAPPRRRPSSLPPWPWPHPQPPPPPSELVVAGDASSSFVFVRRLLHHRRSPAGCSCTTPMAHHRRPTARRQTCSPRQARRQRRGRPLQSPAGEARPQGGGTAVSCKQGGVGAAVWEDMAAAAIFFLLLCVCDCCGLFGFLGSNRNQTELLETEFGRFLFTKRTDRFSFLRNRTFVRTEEPNRSIGSSRMPSPSWHQCKFFLSRDPKMTCMHS